MRKRIDESQWSAVRLAAPMRGRVTEVCVSKQSGEVVLLGIPEHDDEDHNCDYNGCGMCHVLWRGKADS